MRFVLQVECVHCTTSFTLELGEVGVGVPLVCPHCSGQRLLGREEAWRLLRTLSEEFRATLSLWLIAPDNVREDGRQRPAASG